MAFNAELANKTLAYIKEHPNEWNQEDWSRCFAGICLKIQGYTVSPYSSVYTADGEYVGRVSKVARTELGLTTDWDPVSSMLFFYRNTIEDLEHLVIVLSNRNTETENR